MSGACQAPSPSDTIPHLCLSALLQDRRKALSKHTSHSSGTSHMRLPQSNPAVICHHAPRQEARCTALHVATQRAATAGAACCVGHRSTVHFQGWNYAPARRAHRGSLFTRPNMCRNASPPLTENSAARQQGILPRSAPAQLLFYRCRVPFTAPYAPAPVAAAD